MAIAADLIRGHTEMIILARLVGQDSYGYEINKAIKSISGGRYELKEATLYTVFRRLEDAGLITSYWGGETTGARRRYYSITPRGLEAYRQQLGVWRETRDIIDSLTKAEEEENA
ncbi:MAG: PadR family transcriptional regulator [Clostridiales bacterium]|nr:PadR family transcriptional regulator [Clostridiales bacterium]